MRCRAPRKRSVPTQSVVQGFFEITNSSSSSRLWNLGIGPLRAAQARFGPVGRLWVVSVLLLSTRGQNDRCAPGSPSLHPVSPASPRAVPSPCPGRRTRDAARRRADQACTGKPLVSPGMTGSTRTATERGVVTAGEPAHTRSPQPVHIPGDNFSMSRPWSPAERAPSLPDVRGSALSTHPHRCG